MSQMLEETPVAELEDAVPAIDETPVTEEMVFPWLARIRPQLAMAVFREPEFALIAAYAFSGFRLNTQGYLNPIVRRRLAQIAVKDHEFAERLRVLAEVAEATAPERPPKAAAPAEAKHPAVNASDSPPSQNGIAALRTERDRRRRERDEARAELEELRKALTVATASRQAAEAASQNIQKTVERQAQRIARFERQIAKMEVEHTALLRALSKQQAPTPIPAETRITTPLPTPATDAGTAAPSLWEEAVLHLLDKGKAENALALAEDVLHNDPDDIGALEIAAAAAEQRKETKTAAEYWQHALSVLLARGDIAHGVAILHRLLLIGVLDANSAKLARQLLAGIAAAEPDTVASLRAVLARLRALRPDAHAWMVDLIGRVDEHTLIPMLIPLPGALDLEDHLPLTLPFGMPPVSARGLIEAVDRGDVALVEAVRAGLAHLAQTDLETSARVTAVLERASQGDLSYLVTLYDPPSGPIVVDGSNAAWHDQAVLSAGRARLRTLLDVRRALRTKGYFPIIIFGDAPLPFTVDEPDRVREMAGRGEITLVASGVDADEMLVREAKRLGAPLVTNDYMTDWDPNNEVDKIRFTVSTTGDVYLLTPIAED